VPAERGSPTMVRTGRAYADAAIDDANQTKHLRRSIACLSWFTTVPRASKRSKTGKSTKLYGPLKDRSQGRHSIMKEPKLAARGSFAFRPYHAIAASFILIAPWPGPKPEKAQRLGYYTKVHASPSFVQCGGRQSLGQSVGTASGTTNASAEEGSRASTANRQGSRWVGHQTNVLGCPSRPWQLKLPKTPWQTQRSEQAWHPTFCLKAPSTRALNPRVFSRLGQVLKAGLVP